MGNACMASTEADTVEDDEAHYKCPAPVDIGTTNPARVFQNNNRPRSSSSGRSSRRTALRRFHKQQQPQQQQRRDSKESSRTHLVMVMSNYEQQKPIQHQNPLLPFEHLLPQQESQQQQQHLKPILPRLSNSQSFTSVPDILNMPSIYEPVVPELAVTLPQSGTQPNRNNNNNKSATGLQSSMSVSTNAMSHSTSINTEE
eukprot:PhF_6_TR31205/c1_g1_i2/m.45759